MEDIQRQMFGRNIGNLTEQEQEKLSKTTIAIAGVGGVGGAALLNLARIGFGAFSIADPEKYAYSDINRQQGSGYNNVDKKKVEVLQEAVKAINPGVRLQAFPEGLTENNIDKFLEGSSLVIDGLDFFCLPIRKKLFDACRQRGLYVLSSPILGFGTSLAVFSPQGPSFDEFFGPLPEQMDAGYFLRFGRAFFPRLPKYINLAAYAQAMKKGRPIPSFATSCSLSGAVTALEAVLLLLGKKKPACVPFIRHYDLFDAKVKVLDSRKRKINFFQKMILKAVLSRNKEMSAYKELIDNL